MSDLTTKVSPEELSEEDDAQAEADFAVGAGEAKSPTTEEGQQHRDDAGRFTKSPKEGTEAGAEGGEQQAAATPKYVQLTEEQFARLTSAADKTDDFEKQFSKVFGTVGDMQKIMRSLQSQTPRGVAVKLPDGVFDAMKKDFPELATHMQSVMEATLKGIEGTGSATAQVDEAAVTAKVEERVLKAAAEDLADEFPDWHKIVGAVNVAKGGKPDPNNPFRKWLATKPQEYQDRINTTNSAGVITRAIRTFKSEIKTPPAAQKDPKKVATRTGRIADAVRPKGDGGHPPAKNPDAEFEAGFKTG